MALIGVSVFELHLPHARSLKDKRSVIKGLVERLHQRHRFSIAETDHQDLRQRAELTLAVVGSRQGAIERTLEQARRTIDEEPAAMLSRWEPEILDLSY